jgi:pyruvate-formate lyase-activating enzyme
MNAAIPQDVLERTTVHCVECQREHPATLERQGNRVIGRVHCPAGELAVPLSSDAELYLGLREKSRSVHPSAFGATAPPLISWVPITDHCNYHCPVCYADSRPRDNPTFLPVDEVLRRIREIRRLGCRTVSLTGGEPTLHPELLSIVRRARAAGTRLDLISNGLRIAREPGLAAALRGAGLRKVKLQLDSLNAQTHLRQRGNRLVKEKVVAARRCVEAGLRLGTITTVTTLNLGEVGEILAFALSLAPRLTAIVFQAAAPTGRYALGEDTLVDKEQILRQVLRAPCLSGVSLDDVWPLPHFEPWGMRVHPDCGVNIIGTLRRGEFVPIRRHLDMADLQRRMHGEQRRTHWLARNLTPLRHMLACTRSGRRLDLLRSLAGFLSGRGKHGAVVIGVGGFCARGFIDAERIAGCASAELTRERPVSPCLLYSGARAGNGTGITRGVA